MKSSHEPPTQTTHAPLAILRSAPAERRRRCRRRDELSCCTFAQRHVTLLSPQAHKRSSRGWIRPGQHGRGHPEADAAGRAGPGQVVRQLASGERPVPPIGACAVVAALSAHRSCTQTLAASPQTLPRELTHAPRPPAPRRSRTMPGLLSCCCGGSSATKDDGHELLWEPPADSATARRRRGRRGASSPAPAFGEGALREDRFAPQFADPFQRTAGAWACSCVCWWGSKPHMLRCSRTSVHAR